MVYNGRAMYPILGILIPNLLAEGYILARAATGYRELSTLEGALILGGTTLAMGVGATLGVYLDKLTRRRNNSHGTI